MPNSDCVTALFDTCLFQDSPGHETVLESLDGSVPSLRGPHNSLVKMVTRRVPKRWNQAQSDALLAIAQFAREDRVHLFTYSEIELETLNGTLFPSSQIADCFDGVTIDHLDPPIDRSKLQKMSEDEFCKKETRVKFFDWLRSINPADLADKPWFLATFSAFERRNFESLGRFRAICRDLAQTHFPDAFHLWTAEVHGLDYFLTADKKFINALTKSSRINLITRPIGPSDFVAELTQSGKC
jgi:predicted nucleic acid-binding protein